MKKYLVFFLILGLFSANVCLAQELIQEPLKKPVPEKVKLSPLTHMWDWAWQKIKAAWNKIYYFLSLEVEKRKPEVKQELKKETEELKEEIKEEAPSWWQRLKDLVR